MTRRRSSFPGCAGSSRRSDSRGSAPVETLPRCSPVFLFPRCSRSWQRRARFRAPARRSRRRSRPPRPSCRWRRGSLPGSWADAAGVAAQAESLRERAVQLVDEDAEAYRSRARGAGRRRREGQAGAAGLGARAGHCGGCRAAARARPSRCRPDRALRRGGRAGRAARPCRRRGGGRARGGRRPRGAGARGGEPHRAARRRAGGGGRSPRRRRRDGGQVAVEMLWTRKARPEPGFSQAGQELLGRRLFHPRVRELDMRLDVVALVVVSAGSWVTLTSLRCPSTSVSSSLRCSSDISLLLGPCVRCSHSLDVRRSRDLPSFRTGRKAKGPACAGPLQRS